MLVLKVLAVVLGLGAAVAGIAVLNGHAKARFGYRFFGFGSLLLWAAAVWALSIGVELVQRPALTMQGVVLCAATIVGVVALCVRNVRRTNLALGLAGSTVQALLSVPVAVVAPLLLLIGLGLLLLRGAGSASAGYDAYDTDSSSAAYTHYSSSGPWHGDGSRHVFPPSIRMGG